METSEQHVKSVQSQQHKDFEYISQLLVWRASFTDKANAFLFIKVRCEFWSRHTSKMGDIVKIFNCLNPLKIERSVIACFFKQTVFPIFFSNARLI